MPGVRHWWTVNKQFVDHCLKNNFMNSFMKFIKCALSEEFRRYWSTVVDSYRLSYWNLWDCGSSTIGRITLCQYESPVNTIQLLGSFDFSLSSADWALPLELYDKTSTAKGASEFTSKSIDYAMRTDCGHSIPSPKENDEFEFNLSWIQVANMHLY